jgi:hypothetical protein
LAAARSPEIRTIRWGSVVLADGRRFKDVKLFPGGAREWDWNETGTRHRPGIQLADVQELIDRGASVVVLSRGQLGRLGVAPETLEALEGLGIECHVLETRQAIDLYQQLRLEHDTGALIHSTC